MNPKWLEASTEVAWRLAVHRSYDGENGRAVAAIRRRVPGTPREDAERVLAAALEMVADRRRVLAPRVLPYLERKRIDDFSPLHEHLAPHVEAFGSERVDIVLGNSLFDDHLK